LKGICASSWTITKNHCMMHGQQNVKLYVATRINYKFPLSVSFRFHSTTRSKYFPQHRLSKCPHSS